MLVIVPAAQVHRIALPRALGHAEEVDEKAQALVGPRRQQLDVPEMRQVERTDRGLHVAAF